MEDTKLLQLLQTDPGIGMEKLIEQYAGLVYAVIRGRFLGSYCVSSDIEDCVADVFSEFYINLAKYDPEKSSVKAYLCVMARNNAIDLLRKRGRQRGDLSIDDLDQAYGISDDVSIVSDFNDAELRRAVLDAVWNLGEPDTSIILRKFYLGQSSKEISEALGLTVSNIDTKAHRALNKLRKLFGGGEK